MPHDFKSHLRMLLKRRRGQPNGSQPSTNLLLQQVFWKCDGRERCTYDAPNILIVELIELYEVLKALLKANVVLHKSLTDRERSLTSPVFLN